MDKETKGTLHVINCNELSGIRFGIIRANSLDPEVIDQIQDEGKAPKWEDAHQELANEAERMAEDIEDEVRIAITERGGVTDGEYETLWEELVDEAYAKLGFSDRDDFVNHHIDKGLDDCNIEEPVYEFDIDGVKGRTTWLGGAQLVWVFESPTLALVNLCSPCVPNCGNLDSLNPDGVECYDVPADWRSK